MPVRSVLAAVMPKGFLEDPIDLKFEGDSTGR